MTRRKPSTRKKMAKSLSSWRRVGNAKLIQLSTMVHRRESENAVQDKTIVGDEGYRVWKGNTKADAMQLVTIILGQFCFLWTSVGIPGDILILISSPSSAISDSGVAGNGLGGGDGDSGGANSCDDGSGGTTWDGGRFPEGDDGDGVSCNICVMPKIPQNVRAYYMVGLK